MNTKAVVSSAILVICYCTAVHAQWPLQTYGERNVWEAEVGTRILDRQGDRNDLVLITDRVTLQPLFDGEEASDLDVSGGADFRFQKMGCYDTSWEVRGFFNSWEVNEAVVGDLVAPAFTPPGVPGNAQLNAFDYFYDSELASIELNFKRAVMPGWTLLIGPRFISLEEDAEVDANFFTPVLGNFLQFESITRTSNSLAGLNLGLEHRRPLSRDLFFIGSIKGGIFANSVSSSITLQNFVFGFPGQVDTLINDRDTVTAAIGEINVRLHYDIVPGSVSLYTGYEAMWLDGVAIAPTQILAAATPATPVINSQTTVFAHGLSIGGMFRF